MSERRLRGIDHDFEYYPDYSWMHSCISTIHGHNRSQNFAKICALPGTSICSVLPGQQAEAKNATAK